MDALQEDYAAKHNVSEEDRMAVEEDGKAAADPMHLHFRWLVLFPMLAGARNKVVYS